MTVAARQARLKLLLAAVVAGAALLSAPACSAAPRNLSDADLIAYAHAPYDAGAMMGKQITLGLHRGVPVVVEFPCSDICPQYTTQIIHYGVAPGGACAAAGGVTQARSVPFSIAMIKRDFCIPKPLASGH